MTSWSTCSSSRSVASRPATGTFGKFPPHRRSGFTLLEVLMVVFILSAIALSTVSFTDELDQQIRFDDTATRSRYIRRAVVGDVSRDANGTPIVSGFVADVGRLPINLQELIEQGSLPSWQLDATSNQWFGWRGPYLETVREAVSGLKVYRDGWGNVDLVPANDALNFGWNVVVEPSPGQLVVQSFGSDSQVGGPAGDVYAADYPPVADPLVLQQDHQIDIQGWAVTISFFNPSGGSKLPNQAKDLRVRFYYPQGGSIVSVDSNVKTLNRQSILDGKAQALDFLFPATPQLIPWGVRSLVVIDDTSAVYLAASNNPKNVTFLPRGQLPTKEFTWFME